MIKRGGLALLAVLIVGIAAGCGSSGEEPSDAQKKLVPEAKDGGEVKGEQFNRTSDRN